MAERTTRRFLLLALLAGPLAQRPASAQSLARFEPAVAEAGAPGALVLRFVRERAERTEPQAWPAQELGWLFVREEGTQSNLDALPPLSADATELRLERAGGGCVLVGWDPPPRVEPVRPAELRAFVAERSGPRALPRALAALEGDAPVSVLRLESLALLVAPLAGAPPDAVAISKSGQRMELRALLDPLLLAAGSDLAFKLYLPEGGREDVLVRSVHLASREARLLALSADGSVRVQAGLPGAWMLEASRVRPLDPAGGAALELASVTLVFTVRPPVPGEKGAKEGGR